MADPSGKVAPISGVLPGPTDPPAASGRDPPRTRRTTQHPRIPFRAVLGVADERAALFGVASPREAP